MQVMLSNEDVANIIAKYYNIKREKVKIEDDNYFSFEVNDISQINKGDNNG